MSLTMQNPNVYETEYMQFVRVLTVPAWRIIQLNGTLAPETLCPQSIKRGDN